MHHSLDVSFVSRINLSLNVSPKPEIKSVHIGIEIFLIILSINCRCCCIWFPVLSWARCNLWWGLRVIEGCGFLQVQFSRCLSKCRICSTGIFFTKSEFSCDMQVCGQPVFSGVATDPGCYWSSLPLSHNNANKRRGWSWDALLVYSSNYLKHSFSNATGLQ